jgi:predicted ATPase/class 3 adenylate cyclase
MMTRIESEIAKLKQAMDVLEAQRGALGDEVVEAALAPMREKFASLQTAAYGERRKLVTVLFADLAGHTQLFARLDPEDVRELLNAYFAAWREAIQNHAGVVEKFIGDAVMAVFGLPVAQEDDPERAVWSALEMRRRLEELNHGFERRWGTRLAMRVGITTGEVVVGALGERQAEEFSVVGETVNLAARLQAAAPQDGILIAHSSYRLVRGIFSVNSLTPIQVKGVAKPVQVYLVNEAKPRAFRLVTRGVEGVETRMIGREADLKRLQEAFREAKEEGEYQVVTIVGEAGIGKSRLIYEFGNWLELLPENIYYFKGRAYASSRNLPYSLLRSVFAFRFEIDDSDQPELVWEKLKAGVKGVLDEDEASSRKAEFIGRLLGFELDGSGLQQPPERGARQSDARRFHDQALAYLGEYFRTLAGQAPVVVLLEDLHWADDSSLDLVNHLDSALAGSSLLVVCTARPALHERRPNWGEGLPSYHRLNLRPLTKGDSRRLVAEILQRAESVPDELQELLVSRAEGNPFYIEEGIKMLIEEGVIEKTGERWRVHPNRLASARIPATLAGVLQARLDALAPHERSLLQRAAVVGRVFWDHAVNYLGEGGYSQAVAGASPEANAVLSELREREIIYRRERSNFDGTQEYLFKHILMRDAAYESLLKRQRRDYHGRCARWLEAVTQRSQRQDEYAALIAQHYEQAGEGDSAAVWYLRAGRGAAARYADAEALHAFTRALELTPAGDSGARFELLLAREGVLDRQGDRRRQAEDLDSLVELADKMEDPACQAGAALRHANFAFTTGAYEKVPALAQEAIAWARQAGAVEREAEGYYLWGHALDFQLARPEALEKLERALDLARSARLERLEAVILMSLGPHYSDLNRYSEARTYLFQALEIMRRLGDRQEEGKALGNLGVTFWGEGNYGEAKAYFEASLKVTRETGDRRVEGILLGNLGVIAHEELDFPASRRYHLQALENYREIHNQHSECISLGNLAEVERDLGDFDAARAYYQQSLRLAQDLGLVQNQSAILGSYSLLMLYLEEMEEALEAARQALELARQANSAMYAAGGLHRLGQVYLMLRRFSEARVHFQSAQELQRKLGLENRAIEARAGLVQVYLAEGDLQGAQSYLEEILSHLQEGSLFGTEEPAWVYLTCCRALQASGDPRYRAVLEAGRQLLQEQAEAIEEESRRQAFLERVPWNRKLVELWRELHRDEGDGHMG